MCRLAKHGSSSLANIFVKIYERYKYFLATIYNYKYLRVSFHLDKKHRLLRERWRGWLYQKSSLQLLPRLEAAHYNTTTKWETVRR